MRVWQIECVDAVLFAHVLLVGHGALGGEVAVHGVVVRHVVQAAEDEQMDDEEVGAEDEASHLARQYEAAETQRELVVQLQAGVAALALLDAELGERIELALVLVRVAVEHQIDVVVGRTQIASAAALVVARRTLVLICACASRLQELDLFVEFDVVRAEAIDLVGQEQALLLVAHALALELLDALTEAFALVGHDVEERELTLAVQARRTLELGRHSHRIRVKFGEYCRRL